MERISKETTNNTKTLWELDGWFEKTVFVLGALHVIYYGFMFVAGFVEGLLGALA